jgi:hypothetical protein
VRCVRWMPSMHWVIGGTDDFAIVSYDYHTRAFVTQIAVHERLTRFPSCGDDGEIHLTSVVDRGVTLAFLAGEL